MFKATLPLFWTISPQAVAQCVHIQVKLLIHCLSWRNKLLVHYPINKKKQNKTKNNNNNIVVKLERTCRTLFGVGEFGDFQ